MMEIIIENYDNIQVDKKKKINYKVIEISEDFRFHQMNMRIDCYIVSMCFVDYISIPRTFI